MPDIPSLNPPADSRMGKGEAKSSQAKEMPELRCGSRGLKSAMGAPRAGVGDLPCPIGKRGDLAGSDPYGRTAQASPSGPATATFPTILSVFKSMTATYPSRPQAA